MAQLVFLQRTQKEIEIFGGDVFFDIDGKNVGMLSLTNKSVELSAGQHTIKMYKSHTFDTFIGFAESTITLNENEKLIVRYSAPLMVNQPGNIIITEYSEQSETEAIEKREATINRDFVAIETQKREAAEKYKNGVWIMIWISIALGVIFALYYYSLMNSF
jgi:hypothetical protein